MKKDKSSDDELLNNPHIRKSLIQIARGEGEAGRFMIKVREGKASDKEIADWLKKDFKKTLKAFNETHITKPRIMEINEKLGKEFNTDSGLGGNKSNLDYALSLENPYDIAREILRGHPFIDGNKRTALMVYMLLTTNKSYEEILKGYYDIFLALSR